MFIVLFYAKYIGNNKSVLILLLLDSYLKLDMLMFFLFVCFFMHWL